MTLEEAKAIKPTPEDLIRFERLRNIRDEDIDFSDIPEFTDEELARFRRVGHGGARRNAGRKPSGNHSITLQLPRTKIAKIRLLAKKEKKSLSAVADEHLILA